MAVECASVLSPERARGRGTFHMRWRARRPPHPVDIPQFAAQATSLSRAHPAGGSRRSPPIPANPRNAEVGKPCSRRESPPIPAQAGSAMTGLSRRRSRVRVSSLPPLKAPANQQVALSDRARRVASWPNPVAQTIHGKSLQNGQFWRNLVSGRTKCTRSTRLARAKR
jgi:hypothetical protein